MMDNGIPCDVFPFTANAPIWFIGVFGARAKLY
jgi:hypothetical protein